MEKNNIAYCLLVSVLTCSCVNQRFLTLPKLFEHHTLGSDVVISSALNGVRASSLGGNIRIGSAREKANVKTIRGDIVIKSFSGKINAMTISGKIYIKIDDDTLNDKSYGDITAINGNVYLAISEYNSPNIYVEIASTNSGSNHKLLSDLDFVDCPTKTNVWNKNGFYEKIETKYHKSSDPETIHIFVANGDVSIKSINTLYQTQNIY